MSSIRGPAVSTQKAQTSGPAVPDRMRPSQYRALARMLEDETGILLPPSKQVMVESRLRKRVRACGFTSLDDYCTMLLDEAALESEFVHLIDCVTTNKTDFFREPEHFAILQDHVVPALTERRGAGPPRLKIWSAAASIGAEPYSLAMVLADCAQTRGFDFAVLGTDICTTVLDEARTAVFPAAMMDPIPPPLRQRYVMLARDRRHDVFRIVPELRACCSFRRLNLMDAHYPVETDFDVIFCRNILIYFARANQDAIIGRLCSHLSPGGYLFVGHAEAVIGPERFGIQPVFPTVFRRV